MADKIWLPKSDITVAADIKSETEAEGVRYLRLKGGETGYKTNAVRIAPQHKNMKTFFVSVPVHFNVGPIGQQRNIGCRRRAFDESCVVCEAAFYLREQGNETAAKALMPIWNYLMNVFVLSEEDGEWVIADPNCYVLSVRSGLFNQIWDEFEPDESGRLTVDLTDVERGYNLFIKRKGTDVYSTSYKVVRDTKPTPFPGDLDLLDGIYDLTAVVDFPTYEQAQAILTGQRQAISDPWASEEEPRALPSAKDEEEEAIETSYREVEEEEEEEPPPEIKAKAAKAVSKAKKKTAPSSDEEEEKKQEAINSIKEFLARRRQQG